MKPLVALLAFVMCAATTPARAQSDPVDEMARKLSEDPSARSEAAKSVQDFLLKTKDGKSFVAADVDAKALEAVAGDWTARCDPKRLAVLVFATMPGTQAEGRVRAALAYWTTEQGRIARTAEKANAGAFLEDAAMQAETVLKDPRARAEITASIEANAGKIEVPPAVRASIERAKALSGRRHGGAGVFGPDKDPGAGGTQEGGFQQNPNAGGPRTGGKSVASSAGGNVTAGSGVQQTVGGGDRATVVADEARAVPGSVLPANFRRKTVSDVPAPGELAGNITTSAGVPAGGTAPSASVLTPGSGNPAAEDPSARVRAVFAESVARLNREGKRREGSGGVNGFVNNVSAAFWNGKRLRCFDQAEELLGDLDKKIGQNPKKGWSFRIATYTGEGHEANGHYWVNAIHSDPKVKSLILDPWANTITVSETKEPVVIKGYAAWYMGAVMDKVMPSN